MRVTLRIAAAATLLVSIACGGDSGTTTPGPSGTPTRIVFRDPGTGRPNDSIGPFEDSVPVAPAASYAVRAVPMDGGGNAFNQLTLDWSAGGGGTLDHAVTHPGSADPTLNVWTIGAKEGVESITVTLPAYPTVKGTLHVQALFLRLVAVNPSSSASLILVPNQKMSFTAQIQTGTGKPFPWSIMFKSAWVPDNCNVQGFVGGLSATVGLPDGPSTVVLPTDAQGNATVSYSGPPNFQGLACQVVISGVPAPSPGGIENLGAPTSWLARVIQGPPVQVIPLGGGSQVTTPGTTLPIPLIALVEDSFGSPIPGVTVTWSTSSGGSVTPATNTTDQVGEAAASWTVGPATGTQSATATTTPGGLVATFTANVL